MKKSLNKLMVISSLAISVLLSGCGNSEAEKDITQLKRNDTPSLEDRIAANMPKEVDGLAEQYRTSPAAQSNNMDFNSVIALHTTNQTIPEATNNRANSGYSNTNNENNTSADDSEYQANLNKSLTQNNTTANSNTNVNTQNINHSDSNVGQPPPGEVNPILDPNI